MSDPEPQCEVPCPAAEPAAAPRGDQGARVGEGLGALGSPCTGLFYSSGSPWQGPRSRGWWERWEMCPLGRVPHWLTIGMRGWPWEGKTCFPDPQRAFHWPSFLDLRECCMAPWALLPRSAASQSWVPVQGTPLLAVLTVSLPLPVTSVAINLEVLLLPVFQA